jgi:hypothetical protein
MSDLVSKISASGLSAGVFLLWWPAHVASQGGDVLLARGVLWAAAFELLLLGFRPLERAIGRAVRDRDPAALAPMRIGRALAVAVVAAAVPAVLLSGTRGAVTPARAAAPKVIVKREIVRREVVVRRVSRVVRVPVPVASTNPAAKSATPAAAAPARRSAAATATTATATRPRATTTAATAAAAAKKTAKTGAAADTKSDLPRSAPATTRAPAATSSTAQPSTAAGPSASSAAPSAAATAGAGR